MFVNGSSLFEFLVKSNCTECNKVLIFTDLSMPYKNGYELAKDLRINLKQSVRIILVSAEEYEDKESLFDSI